MDSCTLPKLGRHQVLGQDFVNTIVAVTSTVSTNVAAATRKCQHRVLHRHVSRAPLPATTAATATTATTEPQLHRVLLPLLPEGWPGGVGGRAGVAVLAF